jgi:hypothetical protein
VAGVHVLDVDKAKQIVCICWKEKTLIKLCDINFNLRRCKISSSIAPKMHDAFFFYHHMEYKMNCTDVMYAVGTLANNIAVL